MDWLTFWDHLIEHALWPLVVVVLLATQRGAIGKLISGLRPTELDILGQKAKFDQGVDKLSSVVDAAVETEAARQLPVPKTAPVPTLPDRPFLPAMPAPARAARVAEPDQAPPAIDSPFGAPIAADETPSDAEAAERSDDVDAMDPAIRPSARVERAWGRVAEALADLLKANGFPTARWMSGDTEALVEMAASRGLLPAPVRQSIAQLMDLRLAVQRDAGFEPTDSAAWSYARNASKVARMLADMSRDAATQNAAKAQQRREFMARGMK